ncbi:unnamed protein product [Lactuca saligna]|uniref:Methylthioribose-1-phosphate isomerase n=1 Tax=Lactuca saligna TaxID=75948 RepID=A0AA35ZMP7_LACSI|nr:unnamed protein product [Lactuca saligna]
MIQQLMEIVIIAVDRRTPHSRLTSLRCFQFPSVASQDDSFLQAIRYHCGSLQLLHQRKLPLDTIYLEIRDAAEGWKAIKDMVVRGAPAIAIAAALSLVVEASKLEGFSGTPNDAASFLKTKLEYLVSSRPTAVNLSDAATKLTEIVTNSAATATEANQVFLWMDKEGKTPLILASMNPQLYDVAKNFIELGTNVNGYRLGPNFYP